MRSELKACVFVAVVGVTPMMQPSGLAQTRCEPTLAQPCKPPGTLPPPTFNEPQKPRTGTTKLDPQPLLPDIKVDNDTSMGLGHGGIIGLEKKLYDPR